MKGLFVLLTLCFAVSHAIPKMPADLARILGIGENSAPTGNLREDLKKDSGTLIGRDMDLIEAARKHLDSGEVEQYMPKPVRTAECHVEFQVTKRVPGRCTKLSGSIPACQAERYIGINYSECN